MTRAGVAARVRRWLAGPGVHQWTPRALLVTLAGGACAPLLLSGQADPGLVVLAASTAASVGGNVLSGILTDGVGQLRGHPAETGTERSEDWLEERFTQVLEAGGQPAMMLEAELMQLLNRIGAGQAAVAEAAQLGHEEVARRMQESLMQVNQGFTAVMSRLENLRITADVINQAVELLLQRVDPLKRPEAGPSRWHLQDRRYEASAWCDQVLADISVDFWQVGWQRILQSAVKDSQSLVLTARGGSGKSVLAAHFVRYLLQSDPQSCPVIIYRSEDLDDGIEAIRRLVGADSRAALRRRINETLESGHRILFVIDGLDSMTGATSTAVTTEILRELAETSCLLVTCRDELWDQEFRHLDIQRTIVQPLSQVVVRQILLKHTPFKQGNLPVLRIPFFLDAAILLSRRVMQLPETETGLLQALWNSYRDPPGTPVPRWYSFEPLLTRLAELQITAMTYEVPKAEFVAALEETEGASEAINMLEGGGILWQQALGTNITLRLNHDLLDCFNMARLLIYGPEAPQRRQLIYERIADGIAWPLLSMLVQVAHDGSDNAILREVFTELITILDRKRFGDKWMAKSWAATYILRSKITKLAPLVVECLDGQQVPSLSDPDEPRGSSIGPDSGVSQETASSLASAFEALDDWRDGDPTKVIPVLRRGLERWPLRKRFVEALAKYKDQTAVEALVDFGSKQFLPGGDTAVLGEVAEAIGRTGSAFTGEVRQKCITLLTQIINQPNLEPRVRRTAIESKNLLTYPMVDRVPEMEESEVIANLNPFDRQRNTYSDWRVIQRYADYAYSRIANGQLSQPLLDALLLAFKHESLFARVPIARCLGKVDSAAARSALLAELLNPSPSKDVQEACLHAFDSQVRSTSVPALYALRRWMILHAAQQASLSSLPAAKELVNLASSEPRPASYIITSHAFEVAAPSGTRISSRGHNPTLTLIPSSEASIPAWVKDFVREDDYNKAGDGWEAKYRIVATSQENHGELQISAAETTWEEGASFHYAMRRLDGNIREVADRLLGAWINKEVSIPGIASIHCIIVTGDKKVVKTRRSDKSFYAPGSWSVSFEEQITSGDFRSEGTDVATAAAIRGLHEEFGMPDQQSCRVSIMSVIAEFPIVNLALTAVIETSKSSDDFRSAYALGKQSGEIEDIDFINALPDALRSEAERTDLHPTSAVRTLALARLLVARRGEEEH